MDTRRREPRSGTHSDAALTPPAFRVLDLDLDGPALAAGRALLTVEERAHADRGIPAVARRRTALRAGLRRLASEVLGLPPSAVPIRLGEHGRPELDVPDVDISCSRSGELGLVAVASGQRVGIDVERITAWDDDILAERWLSVSERRYVMDLAASTRALAVTRCWTRKEAVLKGIGTGLLAPAADIEAGAAEGVVLVAGWRVTDLPVPAGHVASIATCPAPVPLAPHRAVSTAPERSPHGHQQS